MELLEVPEKHVHPPEPEKPKPKPSILDKDDPDSDVVRLTEANFDELVY